MRVLVVGAGLAGLSAAIRLAKRGVSVVLAERRAFAGGRAYSYRSPEGDELDNGQHVFLGCCSAYLEFLREIGASDLVTLQERAAIPLLDARSGRTAWMREGWLPAPGHFLPSVLAYHPLSWSDRGSVVACARAMMKADREGLDGISLGAWLRQQGQGDEAIRHFWNLSSVAILNEHVDAVSARTGLFVFQEGFFGAKGAARMGVAKVGLGAIAAKAVARAKSLGVEVRFNEKVERVPHPEFDATIAAVPARALLDMVEPHPFFEPARNLPTSPILNLHVTYDRPVAEHPFAGVVASPIQWIFDHGNRVTLSQSAARDIIDRPNPELEALFTAELRKVLPKARDAKVLRCTIVREREATFVAAPGRRPARLPCVTPLAKLRLAGEWTDPDWPSTMEGAVRTGIRAADAVAAG